MSTIKKLEKVFGNPRLPVLTEDVRRPGQKATKQGVLYLHQKGTEYECRDCNMWIPKPKRCTIHRPKDVIEGYGSCGLFVPGKPMEDASPHGPYNPQKTGYVESKGRRGYSCKRCEYFVVGKMDCTIVDKDSPGDDSGIIHPDACCNAWDEDPKRGAMTRSELREAGVYNKEG